MKSMKGKDTKKTMLRLLKYVGQYKFTLVVAALCVIVSSLTSVAGSLFMRTLIDDYIAPLIGQDNPVFTGLLKAVGMMALVYVVGIVSNYLLNRLMVVMAQKVLKDIRNDMFAKMQALPIRYFDTHPYGDTMSRYTNDADTLRQMISQSLPQLFSSAITIIFVFVTMLLMSVWLTLLILLTVFFMMFVTAKVGGRSAKFFVKQQSSLGDVNGYIEEMINGQKVVKVFCREERSKADFDRLNDELCNNTTQANKFANVLMPIMSNLGHLQYVLIAIVGGALAIGRVDASLTLGVIVSFLQLSKNFTMPINQISQQLNSIIMSLAGAQRIFDLMDEPPEEDEGDVTLVNVKYEDGELAESDRRTELWAWKSPSAGGFDYTPLTGDVRFSHVTFGYDPEKTVLHDVTLYAEAGQKVAFVGATGAGKTTITNLINRFYDIQSGTITYDGIDVKRIKKNDLRRSLGVVLQDVNLFTGTVRENIMYGRLDATDEEVYNAARLAGADDFISRLPKGYDTELSGDGGSLSQGQRQLLSIARAAIADPPVMILDEATSSIDTRTESIVQRGMDSLMRGRTVFVIAHRLSTVQNSDVIMVLELGKIIERGSHQRLLQEKGQYYQLYTGAFELE